MRGDEKDGGGEGDTDRSLEIVALPAKHPGDHWAQEKAGSCQDRGQAKRGKGRPGEIE